MMTNDGILLISMVIVLVLERRLNFTTQLVHTDGKWGKRTSGRWDGVVGKLYAGEADWTACVMVRTLDRTNFVNYSPTLFHISETGIVLRVPKFDSIIKEYRFDSVLQPLCDNVWCLVFACLALYTLFFTLATEKIDNVSRLPAKVLNQALNLVCPLLNTTSHKLMTQTRHNKFDRLLLMLWMFPAIILSLLYIGELASYFTTTD